MRNMILASVGAGVLLAACASQAAAPVVVLQPPAVAPAPAEPVAEEASATTPFPESTAEGANATEAAAGAAGLAAPTRTAPNLSAYLDLLRRTSCPSAVRRQSPEAAPLKAIPVPLQVLNPMRRKVGELTFVAGFHLTSPNERFGGLSGLDVLDDGNLLAVSDQGDFVWIELAEDAVTPVGSRIAGMRDESGEFLRAKAEGDAEGLAVNHGLALVSFERNHRVLAFDLGGCGAAARGAPVTLGGNSAPLAEAFAVSRIAISANGGAEPLGITSDWYLLTGMETKAGEASLLSARPLEATPDFDIHVGVGLPEFVGLDVIETGANDKSLRAFSLHRSRNALSSSVIAIAETRLTRIPDRTDPSSLGEIDERSRYRFTAGEAHRLAGMSLLLTIDNFEGIAAKKMANGGIRLYVISDNNFSADQRTLLMVFDLGKAE